MTATAQSLGAPRLTPGDELAFVGDVTEASEKSGQRFRKVHDLEVRVLVLEQDHGGTLCAVLTKLKSRLDRAEVVKDDQPASIRVDLVHVDGRGRCSLVQPGGLPPLSLNAETPREANAGPSWDGPPMLELGMFVPLPAKPATVGTTWDHPEPSRPPVVIRASGEGFVHGARCVQLSCVQQTDGWDRPSDVQHGIRRTERLLVAPADGIAASVERRIETRFRKTTTSTLDVKYEASPPTRHTGSRRQDIRREAELAYVLGRDWPMLLSVTPAKVQAAEFRARLLKLDQFLGDHVPTSFRDALEALRRRYAAAAAGELPPVSVVFRPVETVAAVGRPAPDFVVPYVQAVGQFRLSATRGKPSVIAFFRPESKTSQGTLEVLEALHAKYAGTLAVVGLAIHEKPEVAAGMRKRMNLNVPMADGETLRSLYAVDGYPKFFIVDAAGTTTARIDGFGPETGWLVHEEVKRQLAPPSPTVEVRR